MGILSTQFASGALLTAGSDYGNLGTSGLNEITNRINVESGILGTASGAGFVVSGAGFVVSGAGFVVSGAGFVVSGAGATHKADDGSDHSLLANKTSYHGFPGAAFFPVSESANFTHNENNGTIINNTGGDSTIVMPIILTHGVTITEAVVFGDYTTKTWSLFRSMMSGTDAGTTMASATVGTIDSSISYAEIDNNMRKYWIRVIVPDTKRIYGGKITYTTDYD